MLFVLKMLGLAFVGVAALRLLEPVMQECRRQVQRFRERQETMPTLYQYLPAEPFEPPPLPPVPPERTAAFYFRRVISGSGLVGLFSIFILPAFLPLNTSILAEAFEILLDRPGRIITHLLIFGMTLPVTDLHLYGLVLALALLLLGAAYMETCQTHPACRWLLLVGGIFCLWALETTVSGYRGYQLALEDGRDPIAYAMFSGWQGHICALTEAFIGIWALHNFLFPLLQALVWAVIAPFRALRRWCVTRYHAYTMHRAHVRALTPPDKPGVLVRTCAHLDEGLFEPLRNIDAFVQRQFRRDRKEISYA